MAGRLGVVWNGPPRKAAASALEKIAQWQRGAAKFFALHGRDRRVFINHLSDFFDNQAEQDWRTEAALEMARATDVIFILVTKRPQNVASMVPAHWMKKNGWPANVWMLVTAENQKQWDKRVAWLLTIPAKVRGVSIEPMLEPIGPQHSISNSTRERAAYVETHTGRIFPPEQVGTLNWAIIGGESGRKARPMPHRDAIDKLVDQLRSAGVSIFVKQLSQADHPKTFRDVATFPRGLTLQQFPETV
jgi:protein gp37